MSAQLAINFDRPRADPPRARRNDPPTSTLAAARVNEFAAAHNAKILAALDTPATIHELAQRTGLDHVQIARRMKELQGEERARPNGETRASPNKGRPCRVWERCDS